MIRACTMSLVGLAIPGRGRAAVPAHFLAIATFQGMYTLSKPRGFENNVMHLFTIFFMLKSYTVYYKLVQLLKQRQENTCLLDGRRYRSGSPAALLGPAECLPLDNTNLVLVP